MVLELVQKIGDYVITENSFFDNYGVNAIKSADGRVISFNDKNEKQYLGIDDTKGNYFYILVNPLIGLEEPNRRISSNYVAHIATAKCRLVAVSFTGKLEGDWLADRLIRNFQDIVFTGNSKAKINLKQTNYNYVDVLKEEVREQIDSGTNFTGVYLDFELSWTQSTNSCIDCKNELATGYVTIVDQDDNVIKLVPCGGTYTVEALQQIIQTLTDPAPVTIIQTLS